MSIPAVLQGLVTIKDLRSLILPTKLPPPATGVSHSARTGNRSTSNSTLRAARRLGGLVHSFDFDVDSVERTKLLRDRYFPGDSHWLVEQGSVLDRKYLAKLGSFGVVCSWGVLHHTGAMDEAIENDSQLFAPAGVFVFALYRKTRLCWLWRLEKRWYVSASPAAQRLACAIYTKLMCLAFVLLGRNYRAYVAAYSCNRGTTFNRGVRDWVGGYPYESFRPVEVAGELARLGFVHVRSKVQPYWTGLFGSGCDEFVYRRAG